MKSANSCAPHLSVREGRYVVCDREKGLLSVKEGGVIVCEGGRELLTLFPFLLCREGRIDCLFCSGRGMEFTIRN